MHLKLILTIVIIIITVFGAGCVPFVDRILGVKKGMICVISLNVLAR